MSVESRPSVDSSGNVDSGRSSVVEIDETDQAKTSIATEDNEDLNDIAPVVDEEIVTDASELGIETTEDGGEPETGSEAETKGAASSRREGTHTRNRKPVFAWVSVSGNSVFVPAVVLGQTKSGDVAVDLIDAVNERTARKQVNRALLRNVISDPNIIKNPPSNLTHATKTNDYNHETALYALAWRFLKRKLFTLCGKLLVSVNPCCFVEEQFSIKSMEQARLRSPNFTDEPHLFNLLSTAIRDLSFRADRPQCMVFSGVPSSGKSYLFQQSLRCVILCCGAS